MDRRDLLRAGAIAAAATIAGCADDDEETPDDGDDTVDDTDETDVEADDDGDDADDLEEDGDDEAEDGDEDPVDDDADDDDADDDADDESEEEPDGDEDDADDDETEDEDDEDEADDDEDADEDDGEGAMFAETVEFEDSYAMETTGGDETGGEVASSGRVHEGDTYVVVEEATGTVEMYTIDGETYIVEGEECMVLPGMAGDEVEGEVESPETEPESYPDVEESGRDEIDGEEVHVFEIDAEDDPDHDEETTYYVSVETGYILRIESGSSTTDFHSWGDTDPIEPPEMECMDLGDFDEDDLPL